MKLSQWAKKHGYTYRGAYGLFKSGRFPCKATQLVSGTILVEENDPSLMHLVRLSSIAGYPLTKRKQTWIDKPSGVPSSAKSRAGRLSKKWPQE